MAEDLDQNKTHGLSVKTNTDDFYLSGRPCELSAFSFVPTQRHDPPERTAFNSLKEVKNRNRKLKFWLFTLVTQIIKCVET